jgi:DNA-binding transcriptional regulator PaaX
MAQTKLEANVLRILARDHSACPMWICLDLGHKGTAAIKVVLSRLVAAGRVTKNLYGQDSEGNDLYRLSDSERTDRAYDASIARERARNQAPACQEAKR